ncbi:hypothetical protein Tco_1315575 [Tanacetum coccineum]
MALKKRTTRASPATTTTTPVTNARLKALTDQGITGALAAHDTDRSKNGVDSHNSGTGVRIQAPLARKCTYPDFMKCKPLYFKGTEGVVELTQWFERMETMFHISNCIVENQIKFATCTLLGSVLTWWNAHVRTVGHDVAMFPEESDKFKKYVGGLSDLINRSVMTSKPKTMQDEIEFATELVDKKIGTLAERQVENKRKLDNNNQEGVCWNSTIMQQVQVLSQWLVHWHYKSDCPELKNRNHENQAEGTEARGMVYAFGGGETVQDPNNIEDEIET